MRSGFRFRFRSGWGLTSEAWFAHAVVAVDPVLADPVVAGVAGAVVKVDLTVGA